MPNNTNLYTSQTILINYLVLPSQIILSLQALVIISTHRTDCKSPRWDFFRRDEIVSVNLMGLEQSKDTKFMYL